MAKCEKEEKPEEIAEGEENTSSEATTNNDNTLGLE
jgi:hypothetical protein